MRKWLSLLLALTMCLSLLSVGVLAAEEPVETEAPTKTEAAETAEAQGIPALAEEESEDPTEGEPPAAKSSPAEEPDAEETPTAEISTEDANALPEDGPAEEIEELSELTDTVSLTAANAESVTSGIWGDNVTWTLVDGTLTISGEGALESYQGGDSWYYQQIESITSVIIGSGVTSIGIGVFTGYPGLKNVTIPASVTEIGPVAFSGCTSLTSVTIPNGVMYIGEGAFSGCTSLTSVTILDGVTEIGYSVFSGCTGLTSVTIPSSVTSIRGQAFENCTGLTSVTVPDSVTEWGWNVFNGCTSLVSATLSSGLTEVPPGMFSGCTSLRDVTIPNGVTEIGKSAFAGCTSLTGLSLPEGLTNINGGAFQKCAGLTEATIPASVTDIAYSAFADCTSLASITFDGDAPMVLHATYGQQPFAGVTAMASYYENTDGWTDEAKAALGGDLTWVSLASIYLYNSDRSFSIAKVDGTTWGSGITLSVTPAEDAAVSDAEIAEYGIGKYTAYNIRLLKDGKEIQPDGSVRVCLTVPEGYDGSSCAVFRMESGGALTKLETVYNAEDDTLMFMTDHFSIYLVAETKQPRKPGDINGDGAVNNKDLNRLMKYLLNNSTVVVQEALDVNGDGAVNNKDLNRLMKYLLNSTIEIH